jgi:hypothetical protein
MTLKRKFAFVFLLALLVSHGMEGKLFSGVKQTNSVGSNNTNIGTNPYKDMETDSDAYGTVNPNYYDQSMAYSGDNGSDIAVDPKSVNYAPEESMANYNGSNVVVAGGYYNDYNSYYAAAPPGALIPIGTMIQYPPSSAVPVMVAGARYYYQNNVFLAEVFDGSSVVYQVVPAPLGAVVTMLPTNCMVRNFNGQSFTVCGNTVYKQVAGGFQVIALN